MAIDLNARLDEQHNTGKVVRRERNLVPDPEPRPVFLPLISVDDHLMEPRETFLGRMPAKFADQTPRVVEDSDGMEWWQFENELVMNSGANAMSSWPAAERTGGPVRFDEVRPGVYDVHARVKDMDVNGVAASLCFPSMVFGFCGQRFTKFSDQELGLAAMRAYNDWIAEGWVGEYPERFIAQQVTWLPDPTSPPTRSGGTQNVASRPSASARTPKPWASTRCTRASGTRFSLPVPRPIRW